MLKIALPLFLFVSCVCAHGAFDISSNDPIEYRELEDELVAKGDARLAFGDFIVQADEIKFRKGDGIADAVGHVKIDNGHIFAIADDVSYDVANNIIISDNARAKVGNNFLSADVLNIKEEKQSGKNVTAYCADPEGKLVPSISASTADVQNGVLKIKHAKFRLGEIPVFYWPTVNVGLQDRPIYCESSFGANHNNGAFLQNNAYFGIRKGLKIGGLFDVYTRRGILFGPAFKLEHHGDIHDVFSEFKSGFIRDGASASVRGKDVNDESIGRDRYFVEWRHKHHYSDNVDVTANLSWLSDSEVERDFRKSWYEKDQRPDTFVEVDYRGNNYIASVFSRAELNNFYPTTQRLPELRFDYLPTPLLNTSLIQEGHIDAVRLHGIDGDGVKNSSYRGDIYYGLSWPMYYQDVMSFRPNVGVMGIGYDHNVQGGDHGKGLVQCGFNLEGYVTGYSDYANNRLGIDGLKHVIHPVVQYRMIPNQNVNDSIPVFDHNFFNTEMPSIDLGTMRNLDRIYQQNMFRVGVENNIYTKSKGYVPRKLFRFDVFQDVILDRNYDIDNERWQKTFPDTYLMAGVYPVDLISFDVYSRIDPEKLTLHELKTKTSVHEGDIWRVSFTTKYVKYHKKITEQYGLVFSFQLSSQASLTLEEIYDAKIHKFSRQRIALQSIFCNSWMADIGVTIRENTSRENRFQFDWHIRMLDF